MIYITHIRMSQGRHGFQSITDFKWAEAGTSKTGQMTKAELVEWIRDKGGKAKVQARPQDVDVVVVHASPPYVKTEANGREADNLLRLPQF
jgi:Protein of unknown function (DUF3892)